MRSQIFLKSLASTETLTFGIKLVSLPLPSAYMIVCLFNKHVLFLKKYLVLTLV